jgi:hypothetical protein
MAPTPSHQAVTAAILVLLLSVFRRDSGAGANFNKLGSFSYTFLWPVGSGESPVWQCGMKQTCFFIAHMRSKIKIEGYSTSHNAWVISWQDKTLHTIFTKILVGTTNLKHCINYEDNKWGWEGGFCRRLFFATKFLTHFFSDHSPWDLAECGWILADWLERLTVIQK